MKICTSDTFQDNSRKPKYDIGDNALNCFVSIEAKNGEGKNYVFTWLKNGKRIVPGNNGKKVPTIEYLEPMGVYGPDGLILKLGRIKASTI